MSSWTRRAPRVALSDEVLEALGYETVSSRLRKLEAALAEREVRPNAFDEARARLDRGQPVSRREAAAFLGVSTKKVQRMDASGALPRCPGLGAVVRYAARDVLRLASAPRKER